MGDDRRRALPGDRGTRPSQRSTALTRRADNVPIFPRHGNRMVAVNPALVRTVETQTSGGCKIIFDHEHELMVHASLYEVIKALWGTSPMAEIKELTAVPGPPPSR